MNEPNTPEDDLPLGSGPSPEELRVTRAAVERGLLRPEDLAAGLADLLAAQTRGERLTLLQVLLRKRQIPARTLAELLAEARRLSSDGSSSLQLLDTSEFLSAGPGPRLGHGAPESVGTWRLVEEIGHGGMGVVYRAVETGTERQAAVKLLTELGAADAANRARFKREAQILHQLSHPGIVPLLDAGEESGVPWLAMALAPGLTLEDRLAEGPLPEEEALRVGLRLAEALSAAHAAGVIHRDIKPANVLLLPDGPLNGGLWLSDFGLARLAEADHLRTRTGMVLGTPAYMAPEQIAGDAGRIGPATDVYGLGVLLYRALTDRLPFAADSALGLYRQIEREEPTPIHRLAPGVSPHTEAIIRRAMAKDPADRYPTAAALAADLSTLLATGRVSVARPPLARRLRAWSRSPAGRAALAAAVLAALGLGAFAAWKAVELRREWPIRHARQLAAQGKRAEALEAYRSLLAADLDNAELITAARREAALAGAEARVADERRAVPETPPPAGPKPALARITARLAEEPLQVSVNPLAADLAPRLLSEPRIGLEERERLLAEWIRLTPEAAEPFLELGELNLVQGRLDPAAQAFERALARGVLQGALLGRAMVRCARREWTQADADLTRVLDLHPEDGVALSLRADVRFVAGDLAAAWQDDTRLLTLPGREYAGRMGRGRVLAAREDWPAAYSEALQARELARNHDTYAASVKLVGQVREGWEQTLGRAVQDPDLAGRTAERLSRDPQAVTLGLAAFRALTPEFLAALLRARPGLPAEFVAQAKKALKAGTSAPELETARDGLELAARMADQDPAVAFYLGFLEDRLGNTQHAEWRLSRATDLDPRSGAAWSNLAGLRRKLHDLRGAETASRLALELDPDNAELWANLGTVLADLGRLQEAREALEKAWNLEAKAGAVKTPTATRLGQVLADLGQSKQAVSILSAAIYAAPRNAEALDARGRAYLALKQFDRAASDHTAALALMPDAVDTLLYRAEAFAAAGDWTRALADARRVLQSPVADELRFRAWYATAQAQFALGHHALAVLAVELARDQPDRPNLLVPPMEEHFARAWQAWKTAYLPDHADRAQGAEPTAENLWMEARCFLERGLEDCGPWLDRLHAERPQDEALLARWLEQDARGSAAAKALSERTLSALVAAAGDRHAWALRALARCHLDRGSLKEAYETIHRALSLAPEDPEAAYLAGLAVERSRDKCPPGSHAAQELGFDSTYEAALRYYAEALARQPDHPQALWRRGRLLARLGRPKDGLIDLDRLVALKPEWAKAWTGRGNVRIQAGDATGAVADHDQAARLDPDSAERQANRVVARMIAGRDSEALALSRELVTRHPDMTDLALLPVQLLRQAGHLPQAEAELYALLAAQPEDSPNQDSPDQDGPNAASLDRASLDRARIYSELGQVAAGLGRSAQAVEFFSESLRINPRNAVTLVHRASHRISLGDLEGADQDLSNAESSRAADPGADSAEAEGEWSYKSAIYVPCQAPDPDALQAEILFQNARLAAARGNAEKAVKSLHEALEHPAVVYPERVRAEPSLAPLLEAAQSR